MNGKINFLLDTNIVLGFLNGHEAISRLFQNHLTGKKLAVSQITRLELLGYPGINSNEEKILNQFLDLVDVLPLNDLVADKTISLRRTTRLKLPDAIIAATAMVNELTLVTCDNNLANSTSELQSLIKETP